MSHRSLSLQISSLAVTLIAGLALGIGSTDQAVTQAPAPKAEVLPEPEFPEGDGGSVDDPTMQVSQEWHVLDWAPGPLAGVVQASGYDTVVDRRTTKKIFVASGANPDVGTAEPVNNVSVSEDGGKSFLTTERGRPEQMSNFARLDDGSLIAIDFIPERADSARTSTNILTRRSVDGGKTWKLRKGLFKPPAGEEFGGMTNGLWVWRRVIVLRDGTIMVPAYTNYKSDRGKGISIVLQSTDDGRTWTQRSEIPADYTINEVGWSYTVDGRLVAAVRTGTAPNSLVTTYSDDDARTWTKVTPLLGPDGQQIVGIDPDVVLQPNGILLLATGRPDARVLVDYDGTGESWDVDEVVYANAPSATSNGRFDGTNANSSMVNVGSDRTIYFGDKCHIWGCGAYDNQFGVWAKYLSLVTPGVGKIDVATQVYQGVAEISGDFDRRDRTFPEMRPEGAFDGSSAPKAAAVLSHRKSGVAPSMVVKLDQMYSLDRIGLMLGTGQPLDATVSLSVDGPTWSPVVTTTDTRDHALRFTDFAAQDAQFVKVTGQAGQATPVTELELHSANVQTFENDPIFDVPRGFSEARHAWTTDVPFTDGTAALGGYRSSTTLRLWDKWTDKNATATKLTEASDRQEIAFDWGVTDHRGPFVFEVKGRAGDAVTTPWQFRIVAGNPQKLEVFDGTSWSVVGSLSKNVALLTWAPITVEATTTEATVTINGQSFSTTKRAAAAEALSGVTFSTGDPVAYGPCFYIDDLSITNP